MFKCLAKYETTGATLLIVHSKCLAKYETTGATLLIVHSKCAAKYEATLLAYNHSTLTQN